MSALGHMRTLQCVLVMFALPPKADIEERDDVAPPRAAGSRIVLLQNC
jgi:hypothetical protein